MSALMEIIAKMTNQASPEVKELTGDLQKLDSTAVESGKGLDATSTSSKALGVATNVAKVGLAAMGAGLAYSIAQAIEAEDTQAQLNAVLESTGGAAGLTADEINAMAGALQNTTKFGDDAIIQGQNLLLTFTNIGEEVFPRATETMLDMATALGTDAAGGAIQLGKALNDPVAGISALSRVGVSFTNEQKETIRTMVEMGDVTAAQTIILDELAKEFGGSATAAAQTFGGTMAQTNNAVGEVGEAIGGALIPVLQILASDVLPAVRDAATVLGEKMKDMEGSTNALAGTNAEATDSIMAGNLAQAQSMEDLIAEYEKIDSTMGMYLGLADNITGTADSLATGHDNVTNAIAQEADTLEEFLAVMREIEPTAGLATQAQTAYLTTLYEEQQLLQAGAALYQSEIGLVTALTATKNAETVATIAGMEANQIAYSASPDHIAIEERWTAQLAEHATKIDTVSAASIALAGREAELAAAAAVAQAAIEAQTIAMGGYFNSALPATTQTGGLEGELYEMAAQAGLSAEQLIILAADTGLYTEAQLDAAFQAAVMKSNLDLLVTAMQQGSLAAEDADLALDMLRDGEIATAAQAIIFATNVGNATSQLGDMDAKAKIVGGSVNAIPTSWNVHYTSSGSVNPPNAPPIGDDGWYQPPGHAAGGFTGWGPANEIAGYVHGREFVLNETAVQRIGLPALEAMNNGRSGSASTGGGGGANSTDNSKRVTVTMVNPQFHGIQNPQDLLSQLEAMNPI